MDKAETQGKSFPCYVLTKNRQRESTTLSEYVNRNCQWEVCGKILHSKQGGRAQDQHPGKELPLMIYYKNEVCCVNTCVTASVGQNKQWTSYVRWGRWHAALSDGAEQECLKI